MLFQMKLGTDALATQQLYFFNTHIQTVSPSVFVAWLRPLVTCNRITQCDKLTEHSSFCFARAVSELCKKQASVSV